MATGKVKFFNEEKGYGFIVCDDGTKDVFVHKTDIEGGGHIGVDDKVQFERAQDRKGVKAVCVTRI